jgi:hypothetical protein
MTCFCTLFLRSDSSDAPKTLLVESALAALEVQDHQSAASLARAARLRAVGFVPRSDMPRFTWHLDTEAALGRAEELDPYVHVSWLLFQLKPGVLLADAADRGIEVSIGLYWGGNGTGGGPFVSAQLGELLARHKVGLQLGFYYEDADADTEN